MVRDDMESDIVTSYKNKGIMIPELISLPFFLRSSNICLKNCFSDKYSLRAFIFPHAKFLKTRNLHLLWLQTKLCLILTTPWLSVYIWLPIWFLGTKVNLSLNFASFLCNKIHPSFVIRWWYHHSCCQWHKEDLSNSWIKDTRWKVTIILGYWTLHHFHTQTLQSLHLDWWYFLRCGNDFWRIYADFWVQIWQVKVKLRVLKVATDDFVSVG